jgi:T5SS/PEP-CTERM-associated repeat protein
MRHFGLIALLGTLLITSSARGITFDWINAGGGTYSGSANWSPSGPPGPADFARFNLASTYGVTFTGSATVSYLQVQKGDVLFTLNGYTLKLTDSTANNSISSSSGPATLRTTFGTLQAGIMYLGDGAGGGNLVLDSFTTASIGPNTFYIGSLGTGNVYVQGNSTLSTTGVTRFGINPTIVGTALVNGGGSVWTDSGTMSLGYYGVGSMQVINGGQLYVSVLNLGEVQGSSGSLSVSAANATVTVSSTANLGGISANSPANNGALMIAPGGIVNFNGPTNLRGTANVLMSGGTWGLNAVSVQPGAAVQWSAGTIKMADAATITGSVLDLLLGGSHNLGSQRMLTATSGALTLDSPLTVSGGTLIAPTINFNGPLTIDSYGSVNATDQATIATGQVVQVNDLGKLGATNFINNNGLLQGNGASATVTGFVANLTGVVQGTARFANGMNNGTTGTIRARTGDYLVIDQTGMTNGGNIELSGGVLEYTHALSNLGTGLISGRGEFRGSTSSPGGNGLSNLGVVALSGGYSDIRGDVLNTGGGKIINAGGGVVTFYDDVTHNGSEIRTYPGSRTVFFGSQSGSGSFTGGGTVEYSGDLRPGNSPAQVSYGGSVVMDPSAKLYIELGGPLPGSGYDQLVISGSINLDGGLDVTWFNGYVPAWGQHFKIVDNLSAGPVSGTFAGLAESAVFVSNSKSYQITYQGDTGNDVVVTYLPPSGTFVWGQSGGGAWATNTNWAPNGVPDSSSTVVLGTNLTADSVVDLQGADRTIGAIHFSNTQAAYTIAATGLTPGKIYLRSASGTSSVNFDSGNAKDHTISASMVTLSPSVFDLGQHKLTLSSSIDLNSQGLTLSGGELVFIEPIVNASSITVANGTLRIEGGINSGASLTVGNAAAFAPAPFVGAAAVPEPSTLALLLAGLIVAVRRRYKSAKEGV